METLPSFFVLFFINLPFFFLIYKAARSELKKRDLGKFRKRQEALRTGFFRKNKNLYNFGSGTSERQSR